MNQVERSGAGPGATSRPGAVWGAMQTRAKVPAKSKPAAALAAARWLSIVLPAGCAASARTNPATMANAVAVRVFIATSDSSLPDPDCVFKIRSQKAISYDKTRGDVVLSQRLSASRPVQLVNTQ